VIGLWLGLAFLGGVVAYDLRVILATLVIAVASASLAAITWPTRQVRLASGAALICLLAGAGRAAMTPAPALLPPDVAGRHRFTGAVVSLPRVYPERTDALLRLHTPVEATVLAHLPPTSNVRQGDVLSGIGELAVAEPAEPSAEAVATLRVFDFIIEGSEATPPQRLRTRVHESIGERVLRSVPEPAGTLTLGVLLGDDNRMTRPTRAAFQAAGLTHLTAVSGWNVAVVTGVCELALRRWFSARQRLPVVAGIVWAYAYLVGLEPPVVRAALMASLYLAARWRGRPREPVTALLWSVVAMIAVQPEIRFDVAFQLSTLSTAALDRRSPGTRPGWGRSCYRSRRSLRCHRCSCTGSAPTRWSRRPRTCSSGRQWRRLLQAACSWLWPRWCIPLRPRRWACWLGCRPAGSSGSRSWPPGCRTSPAGPSRRAGARRS
jgi:competence protein ComEC